MMQTLPTPLKSGLKIVVMAMQPDRTESVHTVITIKEFIRSGTFGRVYKANVDGCSEIVALKEFVCNPLYKQREVDILKVLSHCNIVRMIMYCCVQRETDKQIYTLLGMEYMPLTLLEYLIQHKHHGRSVPLTYVRVLTYQMFRGLAYLHSLNVCHRDIKPENLLMDPKTHCLKVADFGSAKYLKSGEANRSYVCSRLYRAPELIANCARYTTKVDIWSAGCVLAELIKGSPLFLCTVHGEALLMFMIKQLTTDWEVVLGKELPLDLVSLLRQCLETDPNKRIMPLRACAHQFYEPLRNMETSNTPMPNGLQLPPLFNFSPHEMTIEPGLMVQLLPLHVSGLQPQEQI